MGKCLERYILDVNTTNRDRTEHKLLEKIQNLFPKMFPLLQLGYLTFVIKQTLKTKILCPLMQFNGQYFICKNRCVKNTEL